MSRTPFFVMPFELPALSNRLDPTLVTALFPPLAAEVDASAHWQFGSHNPTMADLVSGQRMARNLTFSVSNGGSGYTTAPTVTLAGTTAEAVAEISAGAVVRLYLTKGDPLLTSSPTVSFSGGGGSGAVATSTLRGAPTLSTGFLSTVASGGLITPYLESDESTWCAVVKKVASTQVVLGSVGNSGTGGFTHLWSSTGYKFTTTGFTDRFVEPPAGVTTGDFMFMAFGHSASAARRRGYYGGGSMFQETGTKTPSSPLRRVAVAGAYYSSGAPSTAALDIAELIRFPYLMTEAEMIGVWMRSQARGTALGITVE